MKRLILFSVLICGLVLTGCNTTNQKMLMPSKSEAKGRSIPAVEGDVGQFEEQSGSETYKRELPSSESKEISSDSNIDELSYQKYYDYMLANGEDNIIFSPESLNIAFAMYSELLEDDDKARFKDFLGHRHYLDYESTDVFKITNRLWVNKDKDFHVPDGPLKDTDIAYFMDMSDSAKATKEKDNYVAKQTNNFIMKTPSVLSPLTVCDAMNIVYFKDKWLNGDKWMDDEPTVFKNADGSESDILMMNDSGNCIYKTDNAVAYTMPYEDGFTITFILPDEGMSVENVNIDSFIKNDCEILSTDVYSKIPEFDLQSTYEAKFDAFGLPYMPMVQLGVTNEDLGVPIIYQVARIKVDHEGTEAAAVTEVLLETNCAMPEEKEPYYFTADRPFAYFIKDTKNDDIAFIGVVRNMER